MQVAITAENLHPATELALEGLQWLNEHAAEGFANVLDMGCGNGILAIVAAHVWDADVLAVDISPKAVADTAAQVAAHGLRERVSVLRSDGFVELAIRGRAPYDLILFNLLAEPLVRMSLEVASHLKPGGIALIGGILEWKAEATRQAYAALGFETVQESLRSPWHLLSLRYMPPAKKSIVTKA